MPQYHAQALSELSRRPQQTALQLCMHAVAIGHAADDQIAAPVMASPWLALGYGCDGCRRCFWTMTMLMCHQLIWLRARTQNSKSLPFPHLMPKQVTASQPQGHDRLGVDSNAASCSDLRKLAIMMTGIHKPVMGRVIVPVYNQPCSRR